MTAKFELDPDYRQRGNYEPDPSKPSCVRCQQKIDPKKALKCTVDYETMTVWLSENGTDLIGRNCWQMISAPTGRTNAEEEGR